MCNSGWLFRWLKRRGPKIKKQSKCGGLSWCSDVSATQLVFLAKNSQRASHQVCTRIFRSSQRRCSLRLWTFWGANPSNWLFGLYLLIIRKWQDMTKRSLIWALNPPSSSGCVCPWYRFSSAKNWTLPSSFSGMQQAAFFSIHVLFKPLDTLLPTDYPPKPDLKINFCRTMVHLCAATFGVLHVDPGNWHTMMPRF